MTLSIINTVLCILIVSLGYLSYKKNRRKLPLYIAISFGLFGISHVLTILGLSALLLNFIILIRGTAYLLIVFALYKTVAKK